MKSLRKNYKGTAGFEAFLLGTWTDDDLLYVANFSKSCLRKT